MVSSPFRYDSRRVWGLGHLDVGATCERVAGLRDAIRCVPSITLGEAYGILGLEMITKWDEPQYWRRTLEGELKASISQFLSAIRTFAVASEARFREVALEERLRIAVAVLGAGRRRLRGRRREEYVRQVAATPLDILREGIRRGELAAEILPAGSFAEARDLAEDPERLIRLVERRGFPDLGRRVRSRDGEIRDVMRPVRRQVTKRRRFVRDLITTDIDAFLGLVFLDIGPPPGMVWTLLGICLAIREGLFPLREGGGRGRPESRMITLPIALEVLLRAPVPGTLDVLRERTGEKKGHVLRRYSQAVRDAIGLRDRLRLRVLLIRVLAAMGEPWASEILQNDRPDQVNLPLEKRVGLIARQFARLRRGGVGDLSLADVQSQCEMALMMKSRTLGGVVGGGFAGGDAAGADRAWILPADDGQQIVPSPLN